MKWLHISDIHFNLENYDTHTLREKLLLFLEKQNDIDFVLITGDLLFQYGKDADDEETIKFVKDIVSACGCEPENVFICPGNHDVNRKDEARNELISGIRKKKLIITNDDENKLIKAGHEKFKSIYKEITGRNYSSFEVFPKSDYRIISLDTCLLSKDNKDTGRISLQTDKLFSLNDKIVADDSLNIAIMHHGIDFFDNKAAKSFQHWIEDHNVDIVFCGHSHQAGVKTYDETRSEIRQYTCGAALIDNYAIPSFYICNFENGLWQVDIYMYTYSKDNSEWEIDNHHMRAFENGENIYYVPRKCKKNKVEIERENGRTIKSFTEIKEFEHKLGKIMWSVYGELSENKKESLMLTSVKQAYGQFDKVYQFPRIKNSMCSQSWNITGFKSKKAIVLAPNGFGKSSFLRSLMFASLVNYLPTNEEINFDKIKKIASLHGLLVGEQEYLPVYIELSRYRELSDVHKESMNWIYYLISKSVGVVWDSNISLEEFNERVQFYNKQEHLLLLIDGYDELDKKYRDEFLGKISDFQKDCEYGSQAITVIASRPHMYEHNFRGYEQWIIQSLDMCDDETIIRNMIREYSSHDKNIKANAMYEEIQKNPYLSGLIKSPSLLVDVIKGCVSKQYDSRWEAHWIVEKTIEDMLKRFDAQGAKTFNEYGGGINYLYEYFAVEYLKNPYRFDNIETFGDSIYSIIQSGNERRVWDVLKEMPEASIIDLFFTTLSLVIWDGKEIRFLSDIFSCHLAAKSLVRQFKNIDRFDDIGNYLDSFGDSKYKIVIMTSTIIMYDIYGISYGDNRRTDLEEMVRHAFTVYLQDKWCDADAREKKIIQTSVAEICMKCYGENVFVGRYSDEETKTFLKEVIFTDLGNSDSLIECRKSIGKWD